MSTGGEASLPPSSPTCTCRPRGRREATDAARLVAAAERVDRDVGTAFGEICDLAARVAEGHRYGAQLLGQGKGGLVGVDGQDPCAEGDGDHHR